MEAALAGAGAAGNRYGTATHKQVYIYGGLERGPTVLDRAFGMAWGLGGWLLPIFLDRVGAEESEKLRQRVADGDQDDVREQLLQGRVLERGRIARGCR